MHNYKSPTISLSQGVPQDSVVGPLQFITYIMPLDILPAIMIFTITVMQMIFIFTLLADLILFTISNHTTSLSTCVNKLKAWLSFNFLSLNLNKTEILIKKNLDATTFFLSATVRNFMLDPALTLTASNLCFSKRI